MMAQPCPQRYLPTTRTNNSKSVRTARRYRTSSTKSLSSCTIRVLLVSPKATAQQILMTIIIQNLAKECYKGQKFQSSLTKDQQTYQPKNSQWCARNFHPCQNRAQNKSAKTTRSWRPISTIGWETHKCRNQRSSPQRSSRALTFWPTHRPFSTQRSNRRRWQSSMQECRSRSVSSS